MQNSKDAEKLSTLMKSIGNLAGKETVCVITNMDEPLGEYVGNNLEVIETIKSLQGDICKDVKEVVEELRSIHIVLSRKRE